MDRQLAASHFTVKSMDMFYSVRTQGVEICICKDRSCAKLDGIRCLKNGRQLKSTDRSTVVYVGQLHAGPRFTIIFKVRD